MPSTQITEDELKRIVNHMMKVKPYSKNVDCQIFNSWKWVTMLWFGNFMGLRPRSVRLIEINHMDFRNKSLYVPAMNSKTRTDENYPMPEILIKKLKIYLIIRSHYLKNIKGTYSYYLFPSSKNPKKPIDKNYLGEKLRKILIELNIARLSFIDKSGHRKLNKSLYGLRKAFATRVYLKTGRIEDVETMLGHHDKMMRNAWVYIDIAKELERPKIMRTIWND